MPSLHTRFTGTVEFDDRAVIRILSGLPPFVEQIRYLLLTDLHRSPLVFLQSLDEPGLCFIALPVRCIDPDYDLRMEPEDLAAIGHVVHPVTALSDLTCLSILTFSGDGSVTANLMSPVVVDLGTRLGVQAIRADGRYSHVTPITPSPQEASCSS